MINKLQAKLTVFSVLVIIFALILAGCSSGASPATPASTGQPAQQSAQPPDQSVQQTGQQQKPSGQAPDNAKMEAVFASAAKILGVSTDSFKKAFENAMANIGQPPSPPGENMTDKQGQPPSGMGTPPTHPSMTTMYEKMATELNLTADAIEKAMTQAQQEIQE